MKQISSLLAAVVLLLLCGGCVEATKIKTEQEDAESQSQFNLGEIYFYGDGVPQDYVEAAKWYRKAAEQGNVCSQCKLG